MLDFSLLVMNFAQAGEPEPACGAKVAQGAGIDKQAKAAGTVVMAIMPETTNTAVGQTFSVDIEIQADSQQVDGAEAHLDFDPTVLQVTSITAGEMLGAIIQNTYDNISGTADFAAGTFFNFPSGTFSLVTVVFEAMDCLASTTIGFHSVMPRRSDITFGGSSQLDHFEDGNVVIRIAAPGVVGMTESAAEAALADAGLSVGTVGGAYSESVPVGNVVSQKPEAGSEMACGANVNLILSLGPCRKTVPDVVGMVQAVAETAITDAGLSVDAVGEAYSGSVSVGNVISQDPSAGTEVACDASVDLVLSLGPEPPRTFHVDITNDTGIEDGTAEHPFDTVSEAVDETQAGRGDTILVGPGEYVETFILRSGTTLQSAEGSYRTWITGANVAAPVMTLADACVVRGFTILGTDSGIYASESTFAEVTNCALYGGDTGVLAGAGSTVTVLNNTIYASALIGVYGAEGATFTLTNNIIAGCAVGVSADATAIIQGGYNVLFDNTTDYEGPAAAATDLAVDPAFVDVEGLNFHLTSDSPCRNAGNPATEFDDLDETRNDIGADGGPHGVQDLLAPQAVATAQPDEGDAPLSVTFDGSGSSDEWGIASYSWDVDGVDGIQADLDGATAEYTYPDHGMYAATLTVTDNSGRPAQTTVQVTVDSVPDASAVATPVAGPAPLTVAFDGDGSDPDGGEVSFFWDFGDGAESTEQDPVHTYPSEAPPWTYTATLHVTDDEDATSIVRSFITITEGNSPPEVAEAVNPESGGLVVVDDPASALNGLSIELSEGAVSAPVVITVSIVDDPPLPPDNAFGVMAEFGPTGIIFSAPVTILIPHSSDLGHPAPLSVVWYRGLER